MKLTINTIYIIKIHTAMVFYKSANYFGTEFTRYEIEARMSKDIKIRIFRQ